MPSSPLHAGFRMAGVSLGVKNAVIITGNSYVQLRCRVQKTHFVWSLTTSGSHTLPAFLLWWSLNDWRWGCRIYVTIRGEHSAVSYALCQLGVSMLITSYCKQMFLWQGLSNVLSYRYNEKSFGVSLIQCPFSSIIIVGFYPGSVTCLQIMVTCMHFILWCCPWIQLESDWLLSKNSCQYCTIGHVFSGQPLHVYTQIRGM